MNSLSSHEHAQGIFITKSYQRGQTTNQNGVVRCAQVCDYLNMRLRVMEMWSQKLQIGEYAYETQLKP